MNNIVRKMLETRQPNCYAYIDTVELATCAKELFIHLAGLLCRYLSSAILFFSVGRRDEDAGDPSPQGRALPPSGAAGGP